MGTGKVVAITGGARGIGLATAEALTRDGATVWLGDLDSDLAAREAGRLGGRGMALDVTDRGSFSAFLAAAGEIDALVNNAGVMPIGVFAEQEQSVIDQVIAVNLQGVINGMQLALPAFKARGAGHIVNIASLTARVPVPGTAVYSGVKSAVVVMTDAIRHEERGSPVALSCVLPSVVATELSSGAPTGGGIKAVQPEDVAAAVVRVLKSGRSRDAVVPRYMGPASQFNRLLPPRLQVLIRRLLKDRRALTDLDEGARAAYEQRLAQARETS